MIICKIQFGIEVNTEIVCIPSNLCIKRQVLDEQVTSIDTLRTGLGGYSIPKAASGETLQGGGGMYFLVGGVEAGGRGRERAGKIDGFFVRVDCGQGEEEGRS